MKNPWGVLAIFVFYVASISVGTAEAGSENQWLRFKNAYGKAYSSTDEENFRQRVFQQNLRAINEWNELYRQGKVSYKVGVNKLADKTFEERKASKVKLSGPSTTFKPKALDLSELGTPSPTQVLTYINVNYTGCLSPVRDQKNCASGYAITALTLLEFAACMNNNGSFQSFSLDQALDCSGNSQGCKGGFYEEVFQYFTQYSAMPEASYSPRNNRDTKCNYDPSLGIGTVNSTAILRLGTPNYGQTLPFGLAFFGFLLLARFGPIAVRIDSGGRKSLFDFYRSGVYDDPDCANFLINGSNATDHALVLVGLGLTDSNQTVWIAQNSMGTDWGMNGTMYLPFWQNTCNIGLEPYVIDPYIRFPQTE